MVNPGVDENSKRQDREQGTQAASTNLYADQVWWVHQCIVTLPSTTLTGETTGSFESDTSSKMKMET
jgi:hypothetical protein